MKILAITIGDVNGIGPEVALKATRKKRWPADVRFVLVGHATLLEQRSQQLGLPGPPQWTPGDSTFPGKVVCWDPSPGIRLRPAPGQVRAQASVLAVNWIEAAVQQCMDGRFDGLITAPICKEGLQKAGLKMPGHTEFLASLTQTKRYAMMLMGRGLRVVLATRHIPLRDVAATLTQTQIVDTAHLAAQALPWLGVKRGRIAVCGLNPHAGDGGAIGNEEKKIIVPAIRTLKKRGWKVDGPVPPDVVFYKALKGDYAAVVAMYHDQGLGPLKMLAFDEGINVTLGLPIVRTSPDHGTAFDIAGKGVADARSMEAAIRLAYDMSKRRNPWK